MAARGRVQGQPDGNALQDDGAEPLPNGHRVSQQGKAPLVREGKDDPTSVDAGQAIGPQTFAADMLFNGAPERDSSRRMSADAWFDVRGGDDLEVEEQSFLLPNEEILTILMLPDDAVA